MVSDRHLKFCAERGRLLTLMHRASSSYAALVGILRDGGVPTEIELATRRAAIDTARTDANQARLNLLAHMAEHGCGVKV